MTVKLNKQELKLINVLNSVYHLYNDRKVPINAITKSEDPMPVSTTLFAARLLRSKGLLEISRISKHCKHCKSHILFHFKPKLGIIFLKQKTDYQKLKREKFI